MVCYKEPFFFRETYGNACVHAQLCLTLCDPIDCSPPGSSVHGIFQGKNTGVGCHFLLQGILLSHLGSTYENSKG